MHFFLDSSSTAVEVFSRKAPIGTLRRMSRSRLSSVAVLRAFTSLSWLFQRVAFRLVLKPSRCMKNPTLFLNSQFSSRNLVFAPLSRPPYNISLIVLASLQSATPQQQHSIVTATGGASVCMRARFCACAWVVGCHRHTKRSRRTVDLFWQKQPLSLAATKA